MMRTLRLEWLREAHHTPDTGEDQPRHATHSGEPHAER